MSNSVIPRPKRPQLSDSIARLDEMVDGLATAIPEAIGDGIRDVLGQSLAAIKDAIRDATQQAVKEAVAVAVREAVAAALAVQASVPAPMPPASPPTAPAVPRPSVWSRVKAVAGRLRRWTARRVAPVAARVTLGWAVAKVVGGATIKSRSAALTTLLTGAVAGLAGYAAGPVGAAILLGLASAAISAAATWAMPAIQFLIPLCDDRGC